MEKRTICAISTPIGEGAIAVVRLSGPNSKKIAATLFQKKGFSFESCLPNHAYVGNVVANDFTDRCVMIFFRGPNSFNGEDIVEFQLHGGILLANLVLGHLLNNGAMIAAPGEFSQLAFENNKISLEEAEGIIQTIHAESKAELILATRKQKNALSKEIVSFQNELSLLMAKVFVNLDYPEHDDEYETSFEVEKVAKNMLEKIESLIEIQENSRFISKGLQVVIIGNPNVGKSSILNRLTGEETAIVSSVAGTTRDVVCETVVVGGIKIRFMDTAGIRETENVVESIGVLKAKESAAFADLVIAVFDGTQPWNESDEKILEIAKTKKHVVVVNKTDCGVTETKKIKDAINVSAQNNENIDAIVCKIRSLMQFENILAAEIVVSEKNAFVLKKTKNLIDELLSSLSIKTADIIAFELKEIWNVLGEITGNSQTENLIDLVFSKFCLGK